MTCFMSSPLPSGFHVLVWEMMEYTARSFISCVKLQGRKITVFLQSEAPLACNTNFVVFQIWS